MVDGRSGDVDAEGDGFFVGPILLDHVDTGMSVHTDEIFGPVLSVVRVDSYADAVAMINANPTATAPRSSPTTAAPHGASRTRSRSA